MVSHYHKICKKCEGCTNFCERLYIYTYIHTHTHIYIYIYIKLYNRRLEKTLPGLMNLDFCRDIQMVGSEFGVKYMKVLRHTLGLLVPIEHCLNATAYLSIVADHVHPFMTTVYPSSDGYFQQDNAPGHKAQIISDCFF